MKVFKKVSVLIIALLFSFYLNDEVYATNIIEQFEMKEVVSDNFEMSFPKIDNKDKRLDMVLHKPDSLFSWRAATTLQTYNLANDIDISVRNQGITNACWAFSTNSVLETNLALKNNENIRFSARHVDYSTTKTFLNNEINPNGNGREIGDGGNPIIAMAYYTSGRGPILESDMSLHTNENKIALSEINGKTIAKSVESFVIFDEIFKYRTNNTITYSSSEVENKQDYTTNEVLENRNKIKEHIISNGAVTSLVYFSGYTTYFNDTTNSFYCNDITKTVDHQITLVGWDDNYAITNFKEGKRPLNPGAFIALNSWGSDWGNNGYFYISYDDAFVEHGVVGAKRITDIDYDNIYQYDVLGMNNSLNSQTPRVYAANVFTRDTSKVEYLEKIGISSIASNNYKVYVNAVDNTFDTSKLKEVYSTTTMADAGYDTITLQTPILLEGSKFVITVEYLSPDNKSSYLPIEKKNDSYFSTATANSGESYIGVSLSNMMDLTSIYSNTNVSIKAFTDIIDPNEPNEITVDKTEVNLIEGLSDTVSATLLPITAENRQLSWKSNNNQVATVSNNGEIVAIAPGQAKITVASVQKPEIKKDITVNVTQKTLTEIVISKEANKNVYIVGENFDSTGLIVKAIYNNNTEQVITSYIINNGTNLQLNQINVELSYSEGENTKTVMHTIQVNSVSKTLQSISVVKAPDKVNYFVGENFDKSGMIVQAVYSDTSYSIITSYNITNEEYLETTDINAIISYTENTITVSTTQAIVVKPKLISLEITNPPSKVNYIEEQNFSTDGMEVKAFYNDNTSKIITNYLVTNGNNLNIIRTNVEITFTEDDIEVSVLQDIVVREKEITDLVVIEDAIIREYLEGQNFDKTGLKIKAVYDNETEEEISNFDILNGINLDLNQTNVIISYADLNENYDITVNRKSLVSISIERAPKRTEYLEQQGFEIDGMIVEANYDNGKSIQINDYIVTNGLNLPLNQTSVEISYTDNNITKTTTQAITVLEKSLYSIEILQKPLKINYVEKTNFDATGMIVRVKYNNYRVNDITEGYTIINGENLQLGQTKVTISYTEEGITREVELDVIIEQKVLTGIAIVNSPDKTEYIEKEDFIYNGMIVEAYYNNNVPEELISYNILNGHNLQIGEEFINISYTENGVEKTARQAIVVREKKLDRIIISNVPKKILYIKGTDFSPEEMVVTAFYDNNEEKQVTNYTVLNGTNLLLEQTSVEISYTEGTITKTVLQNITVRNKNIIEIFISNPPNKTTYFDQENFSSEGMVVKIKYNDNEEKTITNYILENNELLEIGQDKVTIKYVENDVVRLVSQSIVVNERLVEAINIDIDDNIVMNKGDKRKFNIEVLPINATNKNITIESSNTDILEIINGEIIAKERGTADVIIKSISTPNIEKRWTINVINKSFDISLINTEKIEDDENYIQKYTITINTLDIVDNTNIDIIINKDEVDVTDLFRISNNKILNNKAEIIIDIPKNIQMGEYNINFTCESFIKNEIITIKDILIESIDYEINHNNNYIRRIKENTLVNEFISNITTDKSIKIYNKNNEELSDSDVISTGMRLKGDNIDYSLIVIGDINGDGKVSITDLAKVNFHILKIETLNEIENIAADNNFDNNVTITDLARINFHILKIATF